MNVRKAGITHELSIRSDGGKGIYKPGSFLLRCQRMATLRALYSKGSNLSQYFHHPDTGVLTEDDVDCMACIARGVDP